MMPCMVMLGIKVNMAATMRTSRPAQQLGRAVPQVPAHAARPHQHQPHPLVLVTAAWQAGPQRCIQRM
jgi:hypothetical protein